MARVNPTGTDVDPEQLHAARAAGLSLAELHDRAYAGEFCSAQGYYGHCLAAATGPSIGPPGPAPG